MARGIVRRLCAALVAGAAFATPLAARAQQSAASVYEAARKEGKLVIWSTLDTDVNTAVAARFKEKYPGIAVEFFKIEPGPAIDRIIAEARADKLGADIVDPNIAYLPLLFDRNLVEPFPWTEILGVDRDLVAYDGRVLVIGQYTIPIAYNTSMVKAGEITSWDDLADPKWRGKLLVEGRGFALAILASKWGDAKTLDYIRRILANAPIITKGSTGTTEALSGGQGAISIGTLGGKAISFKEQGAPIDWARVGPVPAQQVVIAPLKGPHPNAARLWAAFWTTPEVQQIFWDRMRLGLVTGPRLSPHGAEIKAHGLEVVLEPADVAEGRRLLEMVGKAIGVSGK